MIMQSDCLLIAAPTKAGEDFMKQVKVGWFTFYCINQQRDGETQT
ncbi:hypothetical protein [Paenibacillus alginolyticus]|nr:hypothetical protein [Paenibacillus alginolyticus]